MFVPMIPLCEHVWVKQGIVYPPPPPHFPCTSQPSAASSRSYLNINSLFQVWVRRGGDSERLTRIFVGTLMVLIPMANILMGCEVNI